MMIRSASSVISRRVVLPATQSLRSMYLAYLFIAQSRQNDFGSGRPAGDTVPDHGRCQDDCDLIPHLIEDRRQATLSIGRQKVGVIDQ